ncbi:Myb-like DNA-binding domain containing protein [Trichomonas vaginalis G3]|uniref:Myb-like DNA-binding domain containing protein n=1 Tax=Trichomonas vaginalis (strain ATCC PRA-98 / G3) TaxID=412133 RepID=A2FIX4_TRIV3|nr:RNA polymerase II transcription regulator recruiting protein [Trichomonas vaginalis G3]XP_001308082.1 RNA polymerase II transcription regulator recruiting protein [Trichomonas vaginalis G3]EAX95151.1 Myb-like DNA-binding domain containing protein [Trichomonas vaginalis G3]EAX95152.1 Myb-like DNA-binding domain containing protein [Trichomonas vaginalis G3]KAI5515242.1 RNA polymerase II transcription regulator recruiting protein [Trichomonas vaginalis G3]KAI5515243.1 RNA polymerase II transcr|eukprot:XP_001308081.1 Myb-like DNA-binding domain containing protein [Trichomonas vaginalis G3]
MPAYNRFSPREDAKLVSLVNKLGTSNWKAVASKMFGRTPRQCKDRYTRFLSPDVNKSEWTEEEDRLLLEVVPKYLPHWRHIASFFDKRNDIHVKNRYKKLMNMQNKTINASTSEIHPYTSLSAYALASNSFAPSSSTSESASSEQSSVPSSHPSPNPSVLASSMMQTKIPVSTEFSSLKSEGTSLFPITDDFDFESVFNFFEEEIF